MGMGKFANNGRAMTTPRGAARLQKKWDKFSTGKHAQRFARRGIDIGTLGNAMGFAPAKIAAPVPTAGAAPMSVSPAPTAMAAPQSKGVRALGAYNMRKMGPMGMTRLGG